MDPRGRAQQSLLGKGLEFLTLLFLETATSSKLEDDVVVVVEVEKAHRDSSVTLRLFVSGLTREKGENAIHFIKCKLKRLNH